MAWCGGNCGVGRAAGWRNRRRLLRLESIGFNGERVLLLATGLGGFGNVHRVACVVSHRNQSDQRAQRSALGVA